METAPIDEAGHCSTPTCTHPPEAMEQLSGYRDASITPRPEVNHGTLVTFIPMV